MNNNKEKLIEVNNKIKELQSLINEAYKEEDNTDKTLIDFFQPILRRMLTVIADKVLYQLNFNKERGYGYDNPSNEYIKRIILDLDPNSILVICQTNIEGEQAWEDEVKRLVGLGHKLHAVKYMKDITQLGLKECKDYIDKINK